MSVAIKNNAQIIKHNGLFVTQMLFVESNGILRMSYYKMFEHPFACIEFKNSTIMETKSKQ